MTFPNIALIGRARSGKTTVARYLSEQYDYIEFAFGEALKRHANEIFQVEDGHKPRELYQFFGEMCRQYDPLVWVKLVEKQIDLHYQYASVYGGSQPIVVSDMRQEHEYNAMKEKGFLIVKIDSPIDTRIHRMLELNDNFTVHDLTHKTEEVVDTLIPDVVIENNGHLGDLYLSIDKLITEGIYGNLERHRRI